MATSQSPQNLAAQQKAFNDQLEKTKDILDNIRETDSSIADSLQKQLTSANELNIKHGIGKDILSKANALQEKAEVKINILQQDRDRLLKKYAKAKSDTAKEDIENQLLLNAAQLKFQQSLDQNLRTLQTAADEEKKLSDEKKKQFKIYKALDALGIAQLFTFKTLLDSFFKLDNQATQMGKSLGISKESAMGMRKEMQAYAIASGDSFVTGERLSKAQDELVEQLGIAVDFGNKEREAFARLTELTGLSAENAGKLAQSSAVTGASTEEYVSNLRVAGMYAQHANKIHISDKELLSSVAKLSAGILIKFQNNPKALAQAVVQAKALGLSLEQVNKTGDSMLNWESSIENELEAELITGKQLNFEKARAAALTGDQATLMAEMKEQAGSLAEYQDMNVIAQESLAKAFGMSRDEMADMLMKQETIAKYGDAAAKLNKDQIEYMKSHNMSAEEMLNKVENQRSTQEKFNDLMTKFQETLAAIAEGPLGTMFNLFAGILENANAMKVIVGAIAAIYGGAMVIGLGKTIAQLGIALGLSTAKAAAEVTAAEALSFGAVTIAIVGGLAYVMSQMSSASKPTTMHDGIMSPSGKVLYSGAAGAIKLNDNDTVVAGTNLGGGGGNGELLSAIRDLHSTMKNQSTVIEMDSQKVGTLVGKRSETGTQQSINSYKLA